MPWDDPQHYEKRSLLSVVKNVKTPTMVLTGEADWRTPMSDSEQYYQALRMLGVESVLVRVPDEPHGIQVRPSHHIAKMLYILSWFDSHQGKPDATKPSGLRGHRRRAFTSILDPGPRESFSGTSFSRGAALKSFNHRAVVEAPETRALRYFQQGTVSLRQRQLGTGALSGCKYQPHVFEVL